jgi:hypothetical protein
LDGRLPGSRPEIFFSSNRQRADSLGLCQDGVPERRAIRQRNRETSPARRASSNKILGRVLRGNAISQRKTTPACSARHHGHMISSRLSCHISSAAAAASAVELFAVMDSLTIRPRVGGQLAFFSSMGKSFTLALQAWLFRGLTFSKGVFGGRRP